MPQGDKAVKTGAQVSYLRGILDGEKLSPDERLELVLSTFAEMSERLIDAVDEIRGEQVEIRKLLAEIASRDGSSAHEQGESRLSCPRCGRQLTLGTEALDGGPVEATCPECQLIIEVM